MEKKKTKLKLSGNLKKSITNIERANTQGANSVVIEKKYGKFSNKRPFIQNRGDKTFLKKWGITTKFFNKHYLKSITKYNGPLKEPDKTLGYIFGLLSCKIQSIFLLY